MTIPVLRASCLAAFFTAVAGLSASASTVNVYLSAPFTQTAGSSGLADASGNPNANGFAGTSTETFSQTAGSYTSLTSSALTVAGQPGSTTFATTGAGFSIKPNDLYGGGGQGTYLGVPNSSPVTITFNSPVGYFGLLWNAVDAGNSLKIYDQNNVVLGTFNASTFSSLLPNTTGTTIMALNGTKYNTTDYYGQPTGTNVTTGRLNPNEQYAYLNFVAAPGTTISKIVESEGTSAIFESDNYAIIATAPTVNSTSNGNVVFVANIPEPASWAAAIVAGGVVMLTTRRRRA